MDLATVINLGLFLLTAVSTIVAIVQARLASTSKKEAASARQEATEAADRASAAAEASATAQHRAADALEEQVRLTRDLAQPRPPWLFEALTGAESDQLWTAVNNTDEVAGFVDITPVDVDDQWILPAKPDGWETVAPGESIEFTFVHRLSSPTRALVLVTWVNSTGEGQQYKYLAR